MCSSKDQAFRGTLRCLNRTTQRLKASEAAQAELKAEQVELKAALAAAEMRAEAYMQCMDRVTTAAAIKSTTAAVAGVVQALFGANNDKEAIINALLNKDTSSGGDA